MHFERASRRQFQDDLALGTPYQELHRLAELHLRREPLQYLWSPEALINESYIRLAGRYGTQSFSTSGADGSAFTSAVYGG